MPCSGHAALVRAWGVRQTGDVVAQELSEYRGAVENMFRRRGNGRRCVSAIDTFVVLFLVYDTPTARFANRAPTMIFMPKTQLSDFGREKNAT